MNEQIQAIMDYIYTQIPVDVIFTHADRGNLIMAIIQILTAQVGENREYLKQEIHKARKRMVDELGMDAPITSSDLMDYFSGVLEPAPQDVCDCEDETPKNVEVYPACLVCGDCHTAFRDLEPAPQECPVCKGECQIDWDAVDCTCPVIGCDCVERMKSWHKPAPQDTATIHMTDEPAPQECPVCGNKHKCNHPHVEPAPQDDRCADCGIKLEGDKRRMMMVKNQIAKQKIEEFIEEEGNLAKYLNPFDILEWLDEEEKNT